MGKDTNVMRRGAVFYVRIRVPVDLRERVGRREIWKSLGTRDPRTARRLAAHALTRLFEAFEKIRKLNVIEKAEIDQIIKTYFSNELALDEELRSSSKTYRPDDLSFFPEAMDILERELKSHLAIGEFSLIRDEADALLEHFRPDLDRVAKQELACHPSYAQLLNGLLRAKLEATKVLKARWRGDYSFDAPSDPLIRNALRPDHHIRVDPIDIAPAPEEPPSTRKNPVTGKTVRQLFEIFRKQRATERSGWQSEYASSIDWFNEYFGADRPAASFTRAEMNEYANFLLELPARWKVIYRGSSIREAAERNRTDGNPTLDHKTINHSRIGHIAAIFGWAYRKGYIPQNPTDGTKIEAPKRKTVKRPRSAFSDSDIERIFNAPLFTGCKASRKWKEPGTLQIRDHRFWLPILSYATGARLSEIASLLVDDVQLHEGRWYLNVSPYTEDGEDTEKSVKNTDSIRLIPIHPALERTGFLRYAQRQRSKGEQRLFPDCQRTKDGKFDPFSKWFARFLKSIDIKSKAKVFHSFRHNMEDSMRAAGLEDSVRYRLGGRVLDHSSSIYGTNNTPQIRAMLFEAMCRVEINGLDHLADAYPAD